MKFRIFATFFTLIIAVVPALSWPTTYPTGTTVYNPEQAHNGYILFTPMSVDPDTDSTIYLTNMRGDIVHKWQLPFVALSGRLLPNGNLVAIGIHPETPPGRPGFGKFWIGGGAGIIMEVTWGGKLVFKHRDLNMHHDAVKLANGHYLYLAWEQVPQTLQARVRGGRKGTTFAGGIMFNDYLVEVDAQGRKVWEWHANSHLNPDLDIIGPLYDRGEWGHADSLAVLSNGNILLTNRQTDSMTIINRKTGKIVWRWGSTTYLDTKTGRLEYRSPRDTLGGPHSAIEIPPGHPGAGNLIAFDNGLYGAVSRAVEINPRTGKLVWQSSTAQWVKRPFSWFLGSAQRLPNGNTLICEGANGRLTQITPQNKLAWEYINPHGTSPKLQGALLKATHYAPEYCPQLTKLPSAKGSAIVAPTNELLPLQPEPQADLVPLPVAVGALAALASLLAYFKFRSQRSG